MQHPFLTAICSFFVLNANQVQATDHTSTTSPTMPYQSFQPGEIWKDNNGVHINAHGGGICIVNNTYYWFGEHKIEGTAGNSAQVGVHCYSSKDLYNWKDEGIALKIIENDPTHPITKGCILERPKVIFNKKTNKYVMWFHLELKGRGYSSAYSGVAISSSITGPYIFLRADRANPNVWPQNIPEKEKTELTPYKTPQLTGSFFPQDMQDPYAFLRRDFKRGQMQRDMTLFVDDDKAYHIYASEENGVLQIAELSDDYTTHNGIYYRAFEGRFMEAPAICKHNGYYYLIASGCTGWYPNAARCAYAEKITGPWTELKNPCIGTNAHITFGGQSTYILPIINQPNKFIFMADQWCPNNAIDGRYLWLPIKFEGHQIILENQKEWKY